MKTLSKLLLLMALVIGGKLSKSPVSAVATQAPKPTGNEVVMLSQQQDFQPVQTNNRQDKPAQAQILSVFFK